MNTPAPSPGIDILNCSGGHIEVRFDGKDAMELERAKRVITDMLKRGYVLFIEGPDGKLTRVERFDPEKFCYIVADGPLYAGDTPSAVEEPDNTPPPQPPPVTHGRRGRASKEVPVASVRTTAIGRSAGG